MKQAIRVAINNNAEVSQDDSGSASFFVGGGICITSVEWLRFSSD